MSKFADPIDAATHNEELFTQRSIEAVIEQGKKPTLPFRGLCYNCDEPLEEPRRFCDEECTSDYEYVQQRKRANGRP